MLRPGFLSAAFLTHRSFCSDVLLIANRHFILLCVSIRHGIVAGFIRSSASAVLLFYVLDPVLLLNFCRVDVFICIVCERDDAVLVASVAFLFLLRHHPSRSQVACHGPTVLCLLQEVQGVALHGAVLR